MKATEFEFRHRVLLNLLQIWSAFQVYLFDRTNIVWWLWPWDTQRGALFARVVFFFAAALVGAAATIRTWAAAYLGSDVIHLVADGPYRHVRNPLYLGSFLLSIGLGFLANRWGFLILAVGGAIPVLRLSGREEENLQRRFGDTFHQFAQNVPRLLPSIFPSLPTSGMKPRWKQTFQSEGPMWGFFVMMVVFAVTLSDDLAWTLGLCSLLFWILLRVRERWRTRA